MVATSWGDWAQTTQRAPACSEAAARAASATRAPPLAVTITSAHHSTAATTVVAGGRHIAVLGDMLELGEGAELLHRTLARVVLENRIDLVFAAGPMMKALYNALPASRRGAWAATAAELEPRVIAAIGRGDAVMVKGSLGSRMGPIVAALIRRFASPSAAGDSAA